MEVSYIYPEVSLNLFDRDVFFVSFFRMFGGEGRYIRKGIISVKNKRIPFVLQNLERNKIGLIG